MRMLSPKKIVDEIHKKKNFQKDHVILDMGVGSGSFLFPILQKVGRGKDNNVVAVDIDHEILRKVKDQAVISGSSLETIFSDLEKELIFKDNYADMILLTNVLHQLENKNKIIEESHRVLKSGGQMIIIDWKKESRFGPNVKNRINSENLLENLEKYFIIKDELDAGTYHFGYLLEKK